MELTFKAVEKEEFHVRSRKDRRKLVNRLNISYLDENKLEYRFSYEFPTSVGYDNMFKQVPKNRRI